MTRTGRRSSIDGVDLVGAAAGAGGAGALVGGAVRLLLSRLRRGVLVPPPWCELGVAALWVPVVLAAVRGAVAWGWVPVGLGLGALAVAGSATDILARRLPDALTLPAVVGGPALLAPLGPGPVLHGVLGALVLGGAHAVVHGAVPGALGAGDVKLAAALGVPLGVGGAWALAAAPVLAALGLALGAAALRRRRLPFGPAMLGAAWVVTSITALT